MPKAKKASTTRSARTKPLGERSANATKKATSPDNEKSKPENEEVEDLNTPKASSPANIELNYLLMITLMNSSDPMINRVLSVPPNINFAQLHMVLQIAFGWAECHMHTFSVELVQFASGHKKPVLLLQRYADEAAFACLDLKPEEETLFKLSDVLEKEEWKGKVSITYEYDMGDGWQHDITVLGRADAGLHAMLGAPEEAEVKVLCLSGEGHPCAEDCGGEPGWEGLKEAFKKRNGDKGLREWYKTVCSNGDRKGLDPWKWSVLDVNDVLREIKI
ncbi:MAG: hypothetical protein LQ342_006220 [Letrouitia transgressa]|nr:MAG: hypothetical protein LQ342_006220 [Letrouitia transgressa]